MAGVNWKFDKNGNPVASGPGASASAGKTLWQQKILVADHTTNATDIANFTFNNIQIGKTYRFTGSFRIIQDPALSDLNVILRDEAGATGRLLGLAIVGEGAGNDVHTVHYIPILMDPTACFSHKSCRVTFIRHHKGIIFVS